MRVSAKPLIGITGRQSRARSLGVPAAFEDAPVEAYFGEYASAVAEAGGVPLHLPFAAGPDELAELVDGLVLSGGDDVDPLRYGAQVGPRASCIDPVRDAFELDLLTAVLTRDKPVLGVCRGAQLVNVALGGTLVADLPIGDGVSHAAYGYPRAHRRHDVSFVEGTTAHRLYGARAHVNSFHHQAVDVPGSGVVVTGRADDGVVEAIEVAGRRVLGLQWHPECFRADPAFEWLVRSAGSTVTQLSSATGEDAA